MRQNLGIVLILCLGSGQALAQSHWYDGFQGDPRTVGRGGAGTVLSDNLWGILTNPAGSALTTLDSGLQYSNNSVQDLSRPAGDQSISLNSGGIVFPAPPWGLSAGVSSYGYTFGVKEFFLSGSRLFLQDRLSLGAGLRYGTAERGSVLGGSMGAIYRLPKRFLVGSSIRSGMNYPTPGSELVQPWSLGVAFGQIPNRVFSYELGVRFSSLYVQPHLGGEYKFIDLRQLRVRLFAGGYHDGFRPHGTLGFGVDPWLFTLGVSLDAARDYTNYLFSFGVDIGRVLKKLRLVPSTVRAPSEGILPNPTGIREDWFPPRLQDDPENSFQEIGPSAERIKKKISRLPSLLGDQPQVLKEEKDAFEDDWKTIQEDLK